MGDIWIPTGFSLDGGRALCLPIGRLLRHALLTGTTGSGKSTYVVGIALSLLTRAPGTKVLAIDPKGELIETFKLFLGALAVEDVRLLDRLLVVDPFGADATVPLNLLAPEPGLERSVHAHVVSSALAELFDGFGPRMHGALTICVRAAMEAGGTLTDVLELLRDPAYGERLAAHVEDAEVRGSLLGALPRESDQTVGALRARLEWLLSPRSVRASLCARRSVTGSHMLEAGLTLVSLGPPSGMGEAGRAIAALLFGRLSAAIFARQVEEHTPHALVVIDEAPEVLRRSAADEMERLLSMARFKRVSCWSLAQTMKQVAAASGALAQSLSTNAGLRVCFHGSPQDIAEVAHLLPVSGRLRDPHRPDRLLTPADERAHLAEYGAALPPRHALFAEAGAAPLFLRAPTLPFAQARALSALLPTASRTRLDRGRAGVPIDELLREAGPRASQSATTGIPPKAAQRTGASGARTGRPRLVIP